MLFIADKFRTCQTSPEMFETPFNIEQAAGLKAGGC